MIKKQIFLAISLIIALTSQGQGLRSQGKIPEDLKMSVQQLYSSDLQRAEKYTGERVRDKESVMEASYRINKMLAGGHIVYGDPLTEFVNRIADTLLRDYPELRSELRFYTVTTPEVNAFTTPQGIIFVNAGLIAQIENEAQLAFIIAHEIIHYYRAHGLETLVKKSKKISKSSNLDDEAERMDEFMQKHNRSHEMENEADSLGIALFYLSSPYYKEVSEGVFDVLQYSYLPFDEIPFDTTYFNTPYYKLKGCWLDTVASITSRDNYEDKQSSHPNILSRRVKTSSILAGHSGGEKYVTVSKQEFENLRLMARLECIRQDLLNGNYPRAFYNSWLLLESDPDHPELNRYMAQALYGTAVFKCNNKDTEVITNHEKIEGESQQIYYAMKRMSAEEATLAALHKTWELYMANSQDTQYKAMSDHLMELLRTSLKKSAPDYLSTPPATNNEQENSNKQDSDTNKQLTKYERIKQKRTSQTVSRPTSYALTDLMMADNTLAPTLTKHLNGLDKKEDTVIRNPEESMLVFNPRYWVVSNKSELKTAKSQTCEDNLVDQIMETAKKLDIKTVDFSDQGMHAMTTAEQYNEFITVCEWMNEFWLTKGRFELNRLSQPEMNSLLDRYNARTLNMTAVFNAEDGAHWNELTTSIATLTLPISIIATFSRMEQTGMVSIVVDAREGTMLVRQAYGHNEADHKAVINGMLYDTQKRSLTKKSKDFFGHRGHYCILAGGANLGLSGLQPLKLGHYIAVTPWASAEFAIKQNLSLAVTGRYHKLYEGVTYVEHYYNYDDCEWQTRKIPNSKNMMTIGLDVHKYWNKLAPLGSYFNFGAHWVRFSDKDGMHTGNTFGAHAGVGRNYILFDRLVINYGVDYAYTYGISKAFGFDSDIDKHYGDAMLSNILTFKLGIGILPF